MKKQIIFLLITLLIGTAVFSLVACADTEITTEVTTTEETTTTKPLPTVGNPSAIGFQSDKTHTLPNIYISTDEGAPIVSRDEYIGASISITNSLNDEVFGMTDARAEVRCRGNYTYTSTAKKSYRLKFEKKVNLFAQGKGAAKSWVLLANHCDKTLLRNHLAFTVGNLLTHIDYTSSSSFVHLYINGKYSGVYQLAEQHNINENRININEDPNVIDTDYLIERDSYADKEGKEGVDYFVVGDHNYNIKTDYPDSKLAEEKCEFLRDYFEKAYEALKDGNRAKIAQYFDLNSLIDTYILQELLKNIDVGWSSFFMVKKAGGKIYFTCPWDFDLALGNDDRLDNGEAEGIYVGQKTYHMQEHEWFYLLMNETWFCQMVRVRWNAVSDKLFNAMKSELDRFLTCFDGEMSKNFTLWRVFTLKINQEPSALMKYRSFKANAEHLKGWIEARYDYLDKMINSAEFFQLGGSVDEWWDDDWWNDDWWN